jgi:hypothetical protein
MEQLEIGDGVVPPGAAVPTVAPLQIADRGRPLSHKTRSVPIPQPQKSLDRVQDSAHRRIDSEHNHFLDLLH